MNAERLLAHYERFADAPDAIARLRRFVLDLAVRGKLVPQDAGDEPASELLKRIAAEKARLVKAGEIRKPKGLSHVEDRELPFAVPVGWTVAPLDGLSPRSLSDGDWIETKDQSEDGGVRLIQLADVGVGEFLNKSARYVTEETEIRLNCTRLAVGDVLIARLPNPIGRACIFPDIGQPAITAVDVAILRPDTNVSGEFLVLAMNAPPIREQIEAYGKGATRFRVSTGHLKTVQIPFPPLAEQRRIVAKVGELMALCDRLEAARRSREAVRDLLAAASLARLNAPDPETFGADARFALAALPALTARPDQIKQLLQTILNLAVRGKLVPQDPSDEPASELLRRIAKEKVHSRHGTVSIKPEDEPYTLPETWKWAALDQLIVSGPQNGISPNPTKRDGAPKAITLTATTSGTFNPIFFKHVEANIPAESDFWLEDGDLLFQRGNTREYVGMAAVYRGPPNTFLFPDLIMKVRVSEHVCLEFAHLVSISPPARDFLSANASGAQATMPKINQTTLVSLPIPLPPLAEQHRIVAKVDALMTLCDRLQASLTATAATRRRLLDALLAEVLAPAVRAMEAAE